MREIKEWGITKDNNTVIRNNLISELYCAGQDIADLSVIFNLDKKALTRIVRTMERDALILELFEGADYTTEELAHTFNLKERIIKRIVYTRFYEGKAQDEKEERIRALYPREPDIVSEVYGN
ncbi:MAG: hypothetical protein ACK5LE_04915 [Alphaproteobacteria bacterium]